MCNLALARSKPTEGFTEAAAFCVKVSLGISDSSGSEKPGSSHSWSCSGACGLMRHSVSFTSYLSIPLLPLPWPSPSLQPLKRHSNSWMLQRCWSPLPIFDLCPCLTCYPAFPSSML